MSDFMSKNYSGLMEAYASIYQQSESVVEDNVEEICFEDLEVDADIMVDLVVDRLIAEGYANTDNQALNMIPHMSDAWLDSIIGNFVLEEFFIDAVNSFVEEGYDLSSYTLDELYEEYIGHFDNYLTEDHRMDLQEVVPLLAAPLLANPATLAAGAGLAAGVAYAGKKAYDAYRQMRTGTDPASQRWLETGSYASTKEKPTQKPAQDQRRLQQGKERLQQRQQQPPAAAPSQPAKPPTLTPEKVAPKGSSGTSAGGAPPTPPSGGGGKPPKIDPLKTVKDIFKAGKEFVGKGKGPMSQVLGKPARERFFGTTRAGQLTRGGAVTGGVTADVLGQAGDPTRKSATSYVGSVGPTVLGAPLSQLGKAFGGAEKGKGGFGVAGGVYGTGETLKQIGREMRSQPWTKSAPAAPSGSGSQGSTPIIKNGQIVGWK